jgi:tetratricopeptide (TPR) repeat protein
MRTSLSRYAAWVYRTFGRAYDLLGHYSKAIENHNEQLAIAKEGWDRAMEGNAYGSLGIVYQAKGHYSKAIEYHGQHLAIAKEGGDRAGQGSACAEPRQHVSDAGGILSTARSARRLQRRWATGRGRAGRTGTSASVSVAGGLQQGHQAPRAAPGDCKGGGRPGGGGHGIREPRQCV